jgi:hypothetical protein
LETSINFIFNYIIETLNILNSLICCSIIFVTTILFFPFWLALLINTIILAFGSICFLLILVLSILKVLYVKHFEKLFNADPKMLADRLLILTVLIGLLPCVIFSCADATSEKPRTPRGLAVLTGQSYPEGGLSLAVLYATGLSFICALTAIFCTLFLAIFPQPALPSGTTFQSSEQSRGQQPEELIRNPNLKKLLLGSVISALVGGLTFYFNYKSTDYSAELQQIPAPSILIPFLINMVFAYYLTDPNVLKFLKQLVRRQWQTQMGGQGHVISTNLNVVISNSKTLHPMRASGLLSLAASCSRRTTNIIFPIKEPSSLSKVDFRNSNSSGVSIIISDNPSYLTPASMIAKILTPVDNS